MKNDDQKISTGERYGMWLVICTVFFVGLLLGWKWAVYSACSPNPYISAFCAGTVE